MVNAENDSRSSLSAHYGALAERAARERFGLRPDRADTHDARDGDGDPWDVKAAMQRRADGSAGRFRLWRDQHAFLAREGGGYVFVVYRPAGSGIEVLRARTVRAQSLRVDWYGAGGHRDGTEQMKLSVGALFS